MEGTTDAIVPSLNIVQTEPNDNKLNPEEQVINYYQNRVFINQLDSFNSKYIAKILCDKLFRDKSKNEFGGEGGEEEMGEETPRTVDIMTDFPSLKLQYEIVGTVKNRVCQPSPEVVTAILSEENEEAFIAEVLKCAFIIFDITQDPDEIKKAQRILDAIERELEDIQESTPKAYKALELRVFVLISTVMTWAKTRPIDPEEPDVPFTESDFRKRKPHPNYKDHINLEKDVIQKGKKFKDKLLTIVIATGLTYGEEEEDLHFLFKLAWKNECDLPIMMPGNNTIPLINIKDLVSILFALFENLPKKPKYILAVEQTPCTQKQIVKKLSKTLGNDRIKFITKEEAFLYPEITQSTHERLLVNLKMEPGYIVNDLDIPWISDSNLVENINKFVKEFKDARKLHPINILIHGPPAVGKTTITNLLTEHYKIPFITVATLIKDTLLELRTDIEYGTEMLRLKAEREKAKEEADEEDVEEEEEEEDEDMETKLEEWKAKLIEIEKSVELSEGGRIPEHLVIQLLKEKLQSNNCQNHGYILNNYPKTIEQTKALFDFEEGDQPEEDEEEEDEEESEEPKKYILPHYIIGLEASDEFLCNRVMKVPEKMVIEMGYTEEEFIQKLVYFRNNNTEESTMLDIFDEREIHPYMITAETDDIEQIFSLIKVKIGEPRGYPLSPYELEQIRLRNEEEYLRKLEEERIEREEMERIAEEERIQHMEKWADLLQTLQHEEQQLLAAKCKPLREYLVKYIFPTLTRGLLETARIKPDDPVDFLAEYLFKENPEGHMFDPAHVAATDEMFKIIEDFQDRLGI